MFSEQTQRILDIISPITSGIGAFLGVHIFYLLGSTYLQKDNGPYFLCWIFFLPSILSYLCCTCTCGRERFCLYSWGSVGGAIGAFVGLCFGMFISFFLQFGKVKHHPLHSLLLFSFLFTMFLAQTFHYKFKKQGHKKKLIMKGSSQCRFR